MEYHGWEELRPQSTRRFLLPRQFAITTECTVLATLVGSCVAVSLWRDEPRVAALCHCVLPSRDVGNSLGQTGAYVDETIKYILASVGAATGSRHCLVATITGGASIMRTASGWRPDETVGEANVRVARSALSHGRVRVVHEWVGGTAGRKIHFDTATGDVVVSTMAAAGGKHR
jgi:chemotaxis protein CheD